MSTESPPSLRESLSSRPGQAVTVLFVLLSLYAVLIQAQVLLVVWLLSVALVVWLLYRFVRAAERIATASERRASAAETRAGIGGRDSGVAEPREQPDGEDDRER